jgi:hypothetical protein
VIFDTAGSDRPGRVGTTAFAVGGYITVVYWFTSSTSFANPLTVARTFSDTFTGIAPGSVPMLVLMQVLGGALALGLIRLLYPTAQPAHAGRLKESCDEDADRRHRRVDLPADHR